MKHFILGTAGHIDHGKTSLVRAMTGRDTDRLKEERERGISIESGFTWADLPSGDRVGIVDVPGHERFIKNMLAGASGIDIVMLVVAADEGIMPQTREHLNILNMLQIRNGIVVVTKTDMVDGEWLEMMEESIREELKGSFLETAPMIPVSSVTGQGIPALLDEIARMTAQLESRTGEGFFRLPVDRVFTITGFGTVVTGTLTAGRISEGSKVTIYPDGIESKVRSIQIHEQSSEFAIAGQRVALNLAGVSKESVHRGDIVAFPGSMETTMMLDARMELLKDSPISIDNRDRLRLHLGTAEIMCRVVLLDREELKPGESALVQLRLEEELACRKGDPFVLRFYSPMITVGGGTVIDSNPLKHKRFREDTISDLKIKEQGEPKDIVDQFLIKNGSRYLERKAVLTEIQIVEAEDYLKIIEGLRENEKVRTITLGNEVWDVHAAFIRDLGAESEEILNEYHLKNPLKKGMPKEEFRQKLFRGEKGKIQEALLELLAEGQFLRMEGQLVALLKFQITFNKVQEEISAFILRKLKEDGYSPQKYSELESPWAKDKKNFKAVYQALGERGDIVILDDEVAFDGGLYQEALTKILNVLESSGRIQLPEVRDLLGTSRKYAMAMLDHLDKTKVTKRVGDDRVLN